MSHVRVSLQWYKKPNSQRVELSKSTHQDKPWNSKYLDSVENRQHDFEKSHCFEDGRKWVNTDKYTVSLKYSSERNSKRFSIGIIIQRNV